MTDLNQPTTATRTAKPRLMGLDLLRLGAVILVLGRHMRLPPETWSPTWRAIFSAWQRGGWVGVDLFFVLSGFLVSGLLFSEFKTSGSLSFGRFFTRRGWKIYPPFLALIAATVVVYTIFRRPIPSRPLWHELLFVQNYLGGLWNHTWSLAVEEQFYLLLPLLLVGMLKLNPHSKTPLRPIVAVSVFFALSLLALRLANLHYQPTFRYETHLFATHLRLDSLFCGVAIAYAYHFHPAKFAEVLTPWRTWLLVCGPLLLIPAFIWPIETTPFIYTGGYTLFYLGSGMLLVGILLGELPRGPVLRVLAKIGGCSYSIYLWHMSVLMWAIPLLERGGGIPLSYEMKTSLYLLGSLGVGVVMSSVIELPVLRLRDKWFPTGTTKETYLPVVTESTENLQTSRA